jgi:membrane associated rhomboid family serine protease
MPLRIVDELKDATSSTLRQASLISAVALALAIAAGFLCAAAFVFVLQSYGAVVACLALAGIFLLIAIIAAVTYTVRKRQIEARARQRRTKAAHLLADPVVLTTGLQIARSVGLKRLIPLIAIGGVALGFLATRSAARDDTSAE